MKLFRTAYRESSPFESRSVDCTQIAFSDGFQVIKTRFGFTSCYLIDIHIYIKVSCFVCRMCIHARDESRRVRACDSGAMECSSFRLLDSGL